MKYRRIALNAQLLFLSVGSAGCTNESTTHYAVCAPSVEPTFTSINATVFQPSCGTDGIKCHSSENADFSGGLDLEADPYISLLGADGNGEPANNPEGSLEDLIRVVPGAPEESFLIKKLEITTKKNEQYGAGMPFKTPGSVCADTLETLREWIAAGALNN